VWQILFPKRSPGLPSSIYFYWINCCWSTKLLSCPQCGKFFPQVSDLKRHTNVQTGEKPYSCTSCGKSFARSFTLKEHMRFHTGEKPYNCLLCGKPFTQCKQLKLHMRVHKASTGSLPAKVCWINCGLNGLYSWQQCSKIWEWVHTLTIHLCALHLTLILTAMEFKEPPFWKTEISSAWLKQNLF
jgi:DNA-directed RNA polymerase subunit RPC12/RpoP